VMLNKEGEHWIPNYWPSALNNPTRYGQLNVTLKQRRYYFSDTVIRKFTVRPAPIARVRKNSAVFDDIKIPPLSIAPSSLSSSQKIALSEEKSFQEDLRIDDHGEHTVTHIHYTDWQDMLIPEYKDSFMQFVNFLVGLQYTQIFRARQFMRGPPPPIVVHCYGGIGRTGTLLVILQTLQKNGFQPKSSLLRDEFLTSPSELTTIGPDPYLKATADDPLGLLSILIHMRGERANMVQTPEQYKFSHWVAVEMMMTEGVQSLEQATSRRNRTISTASIIRAPRPRFDLL